MPAPQQEAVLKALTDFIALGRNVGMPKVVQPLERFESEFRAAKPTLKVLQGPVHELSSSAFIAIRERVYDRSRDKHRPGMKKHKDELFRSMSALQDVIFPPDNPDVPETEIIGFAENKETTTVLGDPKDARMIAKQSLDVVRRFSRVVFKQDIETAYGFCANELKTRMSMKRLVAELQKADAQFGGPAADMVVERITCLYADEASRRRANSDDRWSKDTPKSNKRALIGTFWFTNKNQQYGRWVFFWVTEEAEGYRIAKFNQYLQ